MPKPGKGNFSLVTNVEAMRVIQKRRAEREFGAGGADTIQGCGDEAMATERAEPVPPVYNRDWIEDAVEIYLQKQVGHQSVEKARKCWKALSADPKFCDLLPAERLQLINLHPHAPVIAALPIENVWKRYKDEDVEQLVDLLAGELGASPTAQKEE